MRRALAIAIVCMTSAGIVWACSSDSTSGPTTDAGTDSPRTPLPPPPPDPPPADADTCNDLMIGTAPLVVTAGPDGGAGGDAGDGGDAATVTPPPLTGGTIADGTYYLESVVDYLGDPAETPSQREVLQVAGNVITELNDTVSKGVTVEQRLRGTYTAVGTTFTATRQCLYPSMPGALLPAQYEATSTTLVLQFSPVGHVVQRTYVKQ